jgi:quercetin dioxygenase-like cupin family protein
MKGIFITRAKIVNEDERRSLIEIENGQIPIRNFKILEVKEDSYLGGHYHPYSEVMYVMKGRVWDYKMKNLKTGEEETFELKEGDIVFRTSDIEHGGMFAKGSIILDGASEPYISRDFNDFEVDV